MEKSVTHMATKVTNEVKMKELKRIGYLIVLILIVSSVFLVGIGGFAVAAEIFKDGFESGNFSAWDGGGASSLTTRAVGAGYAKNGSYGAQFTVNDNSGLILNWYAYVQDQFTVPGSNQVWIKAWVNFPGFSWDASDMNIPGEHAVMMLRDTTISGSRDAQQVAWLVIEVDGDGNPALRSAVRPRTGSIRWVGNEITLAPDTWYEIMLKYDWSGTNPVIEWFLNGVSQASYTDTSTGTALRPNRAEFGIVDNVNWEIGSFTIWMDDCGVYDSEPTTLLTFNSKYVVTSTTAATTTSTSLQDDGQASQTFSLSASQTVLVIYQANNVHGAAMPTTGMQNAISVDGADYANSWDAGRGSTYAVRNMTFWIGTLASGSHTIKGRFASNTNGSTATISNRVLLIYVLNGDAFEYLDSTTTYTTSSVSVGNDTPAVHTFTPSGSCQALTLYNVSNQPGSTEDLHGKYTYIRVGATDYSPSDKSGPTNYANSVFTTWALALSASATTVQGRVGSQTSGGTVTINRRQLGVLMFANTTLLDTVSSNTQVSTTSSTLVDDAQATITRTTTDSRELLVVAMGAKDAANSTIYGECYGISVDGSDKVNSRGSPSDLYYADSAATAWAQTLGAATHTIQGRFSTNSGTNTAVIDYHRIAALWLVAAPGPTLLTLNSKYVVTSTTAATTTSSTLQDDTQASQAFSLSASQTVLAIYQANNTRGAAMPVTGMQNAISVDGLNCAISWDSPAWDATDATRNTVFWIGTLGSGSHTIKGKFASNTSSSTATVSNRVLLIYILNGDAFQYLDSTTSSNSDTTTLAADSAASFTFTPSGSSKALVLYNITNQGATEQNYGKKAAISVSGGATCADCSQAEQSAYNSDYPDSVFTLWADTLSPTSTTVQGRFAMNGSSGIVTINRRQLGVLLFNNNTLLDTITSDTAVTTTSNSLVNDTQALITRTTTDGRDLLVVAMGTKRDGPNASYLGVRYGISVNGSDRTNSRACASAEAQADSSGTAWSEGLAAGSHTIQGRFSNNTGTGTARVDSRRIAALWLLYSPTAVRLEWFRARQRDDQVQLEWHTGYEVDNLGFHVYRKENGELVRLTPEPVAGSALLAGKGTALGAGHHYVWWDTSAVADVQGPLTLKDRPLASRTVPQMAGLEDRKFFASSEALLERSAPQAERSSYGVISPVRYWLKDIDLNGKQTWHGPVTPVISREPLPEKLRPELLSEVGMRLEERYRDFWRVQELKAKLNDRYGSRITSFKDRSARGSLTLEAGKARSLASSPAGTLLKGRRAAPQGNLVPDPQTQQYLAGRPAVKLLVKEEGWYRVTQPELVAAGLSPKANPHHLQLYADGREQPIRVVGKRDGVFGPGDAIEFYGVGLDIPATDTRVYWLVEGLRPGKRIEEFKGYSGSLGSLSSSSFPYTVEKKDRRVYFSALKNGEEENFFGPVIYQSGVEELLEVGHPDPAPPGEALLEVSLQGVMSGSHWVKVLFNNAEIGEIVFEGQSRGVLQAELPHSLLLEGENLVSLIPEGGEMDLTLLDTIRLTYWHTYRADDNGLRLTARGGEGVSIDGFSHPRIRVFDITEPNDPIEVIGKVRSQERGYAISFRVPGYEQRALLAITEEKVKNPEGVVSNHPSSWHEVKEGYDLVIITHRDFLDNLQPVKKLRESQGLRVALVDVEDLYDEFSFGAKSPKAIKDFLSLAKGKWRRVPRFVLLVGDASSDPKNYLGLGEMDYVPTKLIDTTYMETASDDWFVDLSGDGLPEMAIGRLPVQTVEEAAVVVSKIVGYERSNRKNEAILVADRVDNSDEFNFEGASEEVGALLPDYLRVRKILRGKFSSDAQAKAELLNGINEGPLLVNFIGHGSVEFWRGDLLTSDDAEALTNAYRLPFFVSMTCLNGFFQTPYGDTLAEALMKAKGGGAVAVWTSSGMTEPDKQAVMNKELIWLLFNNKEALTIGEAAIRAKASVSDQDVRKTWILFGDPTTKLK